MHESIAILYVSVGSAADEVLSVVADVQLFILLLLASLVLLASLLLLTYFCNRP